MNEHKHDDNCDCGCDHDHEETTVTLTLEDDTELECAVLAVFPAGEHEYIALMPVEEDDDDDEAGDIYLYRFTELENGEVQLDNIEDDDEYELVTDAFDELIDSEEFDELLDDLEELDEELEDE